MTATREEEIARTPAAGPLLGTREQLVRIRRTPILGLRISCLTVPVLLEVVASAVRRRTPVRVAFCTAHTAIESLRDPELAAAINGCQVAAPDGMPLVWLSRRKGARNAARVYGPDVMLAVCEDGLSKGYRHYFYGSTEETLVALEARLRERFPALVFAGAEAPPFRPLTSAEEAATLGRINAARPDVVWVGLGMPKQDLWAARYQDFLDAPVILAVGAAFDFHAGRVRQAPRWLRHAGGEWLFRLVQEPRRLWRRYLIGNTRFLWLVLKHEVLRRPLPLGREE